MKILFWDTETTPAITYTWSLWPNSIPIQMVIEPQHTMCWGARWYGTRKVIVADQRGGRKEMLQEIWDLLDEADAVVSWNGMGYDSKHIRREFLEAGMPPPSPWREIDLMRTVKSQFKTESNKLDYWAQKLGVGEKTPHTGFQLWKDCMAGDEKAWRLMLKYQKQDVNLLVDIYELLLPWIKNHPNVALYNGVFDGCPRCASTDAQKRGYHYSNAGKFQQYRCNNCKAWYHDPHRLDTVLSR